MVYYGAVVCTKRGLIRSDRIYLTNLLTHYLTQNATFPLRIELGLIKLFCSWIISHYGLGGVIYFASAERLDSDLCAPTVYLRYDCEIVRSLIKTSSESNLYLAD